MTGKSTAMPEADVTIARMYAEAYAAFDVKTLRQVLEPNLRFRQVNPGGYLTLDTAESYIDATAEFLAGFTHHGSSSARAERVGDRIATASRMTLSSSERAYIMEHQEFVTVIDGHVVAIDSVCTGARPA